MRLALLIAVSVVAGFVGGSYFGLEKGTRARMGIRAARYVANQILRDMGVTSYEVTPCKCTNCRILRLLFALAGKTTKNELQKTS